MRNLEIGAGDAVSASVVDIVVSSGKECRRQNYTLQLKKVKSWRRRGVLLTKDKIPISPQSGPSNTDPTLKFANAPQLPRSSSHWGPVAL